MKLSPKNLTLAIAVIALFVAATAPAEARRTPGGGGSTVELEDKDVISPV